ncbi:MAG: AI-2E family transporter, partial [Candidatus Binatia bacterium]
MKLPSTINLPDLEDKTFLLLVVIVSLAFGWILWPFFGAVLWGTILAILFVPTYRRLLKSMSHRRTVAALVTVIIVLLIVILPVMLIGGLLAQEAISVYGRFQSGDLNFARYFQQVLGALPQSVSDLLARFGLTSLGSMQDKLSAGLLQASQFVAAKALNIGQNTFDLIVNVFIVLYLLFFLLRDGDELTRRIRRAIPLHADQQRELFNRFTTVIRATIKGNVVVAIVQGALGGLIFWFLGVHAAV